jgi:hypothetical protein
MGISNMRMTTNDNPRVFCMRYLPPTATFGQGLKARRPASGLTLNVPPYFASLSRNLRCRKEVNPKKPGRELEIRLSSVRLHKSVLCFHVTDERVAPTHPFVPEDQGMRLKFTIAKKGPNPDFGSVRVSSSLQLANRGNAMGVAPK